MSRFKSAPLQPTKLMVRAGMAAGDDDYLYWKHPERSYVDMLDASPTIVERDEFEAWAKVRAEKSPAGLNEHLLSRYESNGDYRMAWVYAAWEAWQARAEL